jgi:hypothetical protein
LFGIIQESKNVVTKIIARMLPPCYVLKNEREKTIADSYILVMRDEIKIPVSIQPKREGKKWK